MVHPTQQSTPQTPKSICVLFCSKIGSELSGTQETRKLRNGPWSAKGFLFCKGYIFYSCVLSRTCTRETHASLPWDENNCQFKQSAPWSQIGHPVPLRNPAKHAAELKRENYRGCGVRLNCAGFQVFSRLQTGRTGIEAALMGNMGFLETMMTLEGNRMHVSGPRVSKSLSGGYDTGARST